LEGEAERRNVPLIELTPAEQQRLPDFSGSLYSFDSFGDLDPLSPLFGDRTPSDSGDSATTDSVTQYAPSPLTERRRPYTISLDGLGITNTPSPGGAARGQGSTTNRGGGTTNRGGGTQQANGGSTAGQTTQPAEGNNAASTDPPPAPEDDATAADLAQTDGDDGTAIAAGRPPATPMTVEEQLQAFSYNEGATSSEETEERFEAWLALGQDLADELDLAADITVVAPPTEGDIPADSIVKAPIELPLDPEVNFCLAKAPQKGLIGAWANGGVLLGEPIVLRSTGYLGLNQQAIRRIQTFDFAEAETFTGYQFEVVVNYEPDDCIRLGQPQPGEPRAAETGRDRDNADTEVKDPLKPAAPAEAAPPPAN
ncbi:MAG TPA: hypothetical protein V6D02_06090, partial [Candidatus Obscuribacterales bacterium]